MGINNNNNNKTVRTRIVGAKNRGRQRNCEARRKRIIIIKLQGYNNNNNNKTVGQES